ncbi:hypothetical protein TNCV_3702901 [Trichonephila clavipes]|nr:hypothetical protein TNCV_3702901 [Trichonephila clavipes]
MSSFQTSPGSVGSIMIDTYVSGCIEEKHVATCIRYPYMCLPHDVMIAERLRCHHFPATTTDEEGHGYGMIRLYMSSKLNST